MILVIGGAAQGKHAYVTNEYKDYKVVPAYHEQIRAQLEKGDDPSVCAQTMLADAKEKDKLVIVCDEVGYGLVPMDAFERKYREAVGRVSCYLAAEATEVIRIVAGLPMKIKG